MSWLIRKATASPASHCFLLYFSEQFDQHMVLEVQGRGFVQVPWEVWQPQNKLLALYQLERETSVVAAAMRKLGQRLGDPYDTVSLLGFLLVYVIRIWDRNDLDDKKKLICSEMVALFLRWAGVPVQGHIDRVVPRDLWLLAEQEGSFQKRFESAEGHRRLANVRKRGRELIDPECQCQEPLSVPPTP